MDYEAFNNTICQKLADLADTETNRKRKATDAEINDISRKIQEQKKALDADIAAEKYDDAVQTKEKISRLESKKAILMNVVKELDAVPEYEDNDLKKLSDEAVDYYDSVLLGLYKSRLKMLEKLEENYRLMEESKQAYMSIKKILDSKTSNPNYANGRTYTIPWDSAPWLSESFDLTKHIQSLGESLKKRGYLAADTTVQQQT